MKHLFLLCVATALLAQSGGQPINVLIQNPSFDAPVPMMPGNDPAVDCINSIYHGPIPGWTGGSEVGTGVVAWCRQPPDGPNAAFFETISQDLGILAQPGIYTLKFYVANWFYEYPVAYQVSLSVGNSSQPLCENSKWAMPDFTEVVFTCEVPGYVLLDSVPPCSPGVSLCLGGGINSGDLILSFRKIGGWTPLLQLPKDNALTFTPE